MTICRICNTERVKSQSEVLKMVRRAKSRAKIKGLEFNITVKDIFIPDVCPALKIPLEHHKGKYQDNSPSLDRINPNLGYIKGNVRVISALANKMKSSANEEQLQMFAKWILSGREITNSVECK